jgi:hypothetical protein
LSTMRYRQHCGSGRARYATFAPPLGSAHRERGIRTGKFEVIMNQELLGLDEGKV